MKISEAIYKLAQMPDQDLTQQQIMNLLAAEDVNIDVDEHDGCTCTIEDVSITEDEHLPAAEGGIAFA